MGNRNARSFKSAAMAQGMATHALLFESSCLDKFEGGVASVLAERLRAVTWSEEVGGSNRTSRKHFCFLHCNIFSFCKVASRM